MYMYHTSGIPCTPSSDNDVILTSSAKGVGAANSQVDLLPDIELLTSLGSKAIYVYNM